LAARKTQDYNAFKVYNLGFTTALTNDGSAVFSTHTLIGGGTQANNGTGALNNDRLNTAMVNLATMKNQGGVIATDIPSVLLVPPALYAYALQLTQSALVADNANNAINVWRSTYGFIVKYSPWLSAAAGGSDTAWFLLSDNHSVTRIIRQGIQTALTSWEYSVNRTYTYQANFREVVYVRDYSGIYGSTGTVA
jgi:phage major head subunit gpT-like protein